MRAVKAGVKNQHEAIRCLESCLLHWDLVNAQQVCSFSAANVMSICTEIDMIRSPLPWTDPTPKSGSSCSGTSPSRTCSP
jgi:hypothetical protein